MKILVFAPYYPPHIGGVESYAEELNRELHSQGHTIATLAARLPSISLPRENPLEGFLVLRYPSWELIPNYPLPRFWKKEFWRIIFFARKQHFDVVISHTRFFVSSFIALLYAQFTKTPLLHIEHGSSFVQHDNKIIILFAFLYDQSLGRYILAKANHVLAISKSVKRFICRLQPKTHVSVVYRGLSSSILGNHSGKDDSVWLSPNKNAIRIIYVGRLISGKGVADLLRALSEINTNQWQCVIIGNGPEKDALLELTKKLDISRKVSFVGEKSHQDTLSILRSADIFVNPSYSEGLPTSVIEAAFFMKPVIATDVGGTSEIVTDGKTGYLVKPHSPSEITDRLIRLINNQGLRLSFGRSAHERIVRLFDWKKSITQINDILKQIAL